MNSFKKSYSRNTLCDFTFNAAVPRVPVVLSRKSLVQALNGLHHQMEILGGRQLHHHCSYTHN